MATPRFINSGLIGGSTAYAETNSAEIPFMFQLGTVVYGADNTQWAYGLASAAISADTVCTYNASTYAITAAAGNHTSGVALASGEYGWVRLTAGATA